MELLDATQASTSRTQPNQALVQPDLDHSAGAPILPERDTDQSLVSLAQEIYQALRSAPEAAMRERPDWLRGELERHLLCLDPPEPPCLVTVRVAPENLPFQAATGETGLLTKGGEEAPGVSVLCEGHDPALLLGLPGEALRGINSGSRLANVARF